MREWLEELEEDPCPNKSKRNLILKILMWLEAEKSERLKFYQPTQLKAKKIRRRKSANR